MQHLIGVGHHVDKNPQERGWTEEKGSSEEGK